MELFLPTLDRMFFLLLFIALGFVLTKIGFLPEGSEKVLSKLENAIFVPALVAGTFASNCTVEVIRASAEPLLVCFATEAVILPLSFLVARLSSRDDFIRKMYIYGLAFSNFGFMGNAVVGVLFPDQFIYYLIFTLPLWLIVYTWGVPALLMPVGEKKGGIRGSLRRLVNPMFGAVIFGMLIGLTGLRLPSFLSSALDSAGACMSPVAMILTGITVARMNAGKVFRIKGIYVVSFIRLIVFPIAFGFLLKLFHLSDLTYLCSICVLAMPLGLSPVVIPAAYGQDTSVAAGMALVSHVLSVITIPVVFMIFI